MIDRKKNYNVSFAIIIITAIIYLISRFLFNDLNVYLGLNPTLFIKYKHYWTPLSYIFAHSNFSHIFFNMFAIFIFGHSIEDRMGSIGFVIFYLVTGALAGLFSLLFYYILNINVRLIGASGAVYALLFAYAVIYPNRKLYFFGIIPINPPTVIILYTAYDLYSQLFRSTNIAHLTHLSGFLFAFLYFKIVYKVNPIFIFKNYKRFSE